MRGSQYLIWYHAHAVTIQQEETVSDCSDKIVAYTYAAEGHTLFKALTKCIFFLKGDMYLFV